MRTKNKTAFRCVIAATTVAAALAGTALPSLANADDDRERERNARQIETRRQSCLNTPLEKLQGDAREACRNVRQIEARRGRPSSNGGGSDRENESSRGGQSSGSGGGIPGTRDQNNVAEQPNNVPGTRDNGNGDNFNDNPFDGGRNRGGGSDTGIDI